MAKKQASKNKRGALQEKRSPGRNVWLMLTLVPLVVLCFWIGVYPKPFLEFLHEPAAQARGRASLELVGLPGLSRRDVRHNKARIDGAGGKYPSPIERRTFRVGHGESRRNRPVRSPGNRSAEGERTVQARLVS